MTKVLLVNPPYPFGEGAPVSLGLSYLAGVLEREDVEVQILDLLVSSYSPRKVRRAIKERKPDLVGATSVTRTYPKSIEILRYCKEVDPNLTTVIGGPHVTFTAEEVLDEAPWIDFVVIGEGEYTLRELVKTFEDEGEFGSVKGIAYKENENVIFTPPRPPIENLNELPFPARNLLPLSKYRALAERCDLITSRGCPWGCIFCVAPRMFGKKVRYRDPKLVVDEIELVKKLGFDTNLADDTFTLNHDHVYAILDEILERNLEVKWTANARVDTVNPDLLKRMKEAGCSSLFFGVESGDPEVLKTSGKGITHDQVKKAVKMAKKAGIHVICSYIFGLPGETPETLNQTLDFASKLDTDYTIHILAPLPGSAIYEEMDRYGIKLLTDDWARVNADEPVTETITKDGKVGPEEIMEAWNEYLRKCGEAAEEMEEEAEAGDESSKEAIELWDTLKFLTPLVKKDLIEEKGRIELDGTETPSLKDSIDLLREKVANEFEDDSFSFEREARKQVEEGNLNIDVEKEGDKKFLIWKWAKI